MASVINLKQDLPAVYKSEGQQYATLAVSILTTSGAYSFTSTSSGTTYSGASGGQQQLFNDLATVLSDYSVSAIDWNLIRSFIYGQGTPMVNGIQTKLVKVNGILTEVQLFKSDLTTLMAKTVLNRTNGNLTSVTSYIYADNGSSIVAQFVDNLNKINGVLDNITRTVVA